GPAPARVRRCGTAIESGVTREKTQKGATETRIVISTEGRNPFSLCALRTYCAGEFSRFAQIFPSEGSRIRSFPRQDAKREVRNIGFLFLCVFAPLREIIPNLVAASPRYVLRGDF